MAGDEVTIPIRGENSDLKAALGESTGMVSSFGGVVKNVFAVIGAASVARKAFSWIKDVIMDAGAQEREFAKLETVVKATGGAAGFTADQMAQMAEDLEDVANIQDEVGMKAQAILATFKNVRGDIFKDTITSAADMAEILGTDVVGATRMLGRALEDPTRGMMMLRRQNVLFTKDQQDQVKAMMQAGDIAGAQRIILDRLGSTYGGAAARGAQTFTGRLEHAKNALEDAGKAIGKALIPMIDGMVPYVESAAQAVAKFVGWLAEMSVPLRDTAGAFWSDLQPAFNWFVDAGLSAFTAVQVVVQNWQDSMKAGLLSVQLSLVQFGEVMTHWFTEALPQYIDWFARNWMNVFSDLNSFIQTVLLNMGKNIWEFITSVYDMLAGGDFDFKWTDLTEGFQRTMEDLPQIAARVVSAEEKILQAELNAAAGALGVKFADQREKNKEALEGLDMGGGLSLKDNAKKVDPHDVLGMTKQTKEKTSKAGTFEDLMTLNKRISEAAAGGSAEDKLKKAVDTVAGSNEELVALGRRNNELLEDVVGGIDSIDLDGVGALE